MIRLTIGNSVSKIEGLGPKNFARVKKALSYPIDKRRRYFSGKFHLDSISLLSKRGEFPAGLTYIVQRMLRKATHEVVDTRVCPSNARDSVYVTAIDTVAKVVTVSACHKAWFVRRDYEPYPEQLAAVNTYHDRGIIVAPTAYGKSIIGALLIDRFQVKTLVVVPSLLLKTQLTASYVEWFGADKVGPGRMIQVENVAALDPNAPARVDLILIDEFHHSGAASYRKLNKKAWKDVYFKFGLTATPFRSKSEERLLLEGVLSEVIYRISYAEAVAKGRVMPVEAYYVDVPNTVKCDSSSWRMVYNKLVVHNKDRNSLIQKLLERLKASDVATLCLVREIEHGEALAKAVGVPFANGQDAMARMRLLEFNLGEEKTMVGTVGVLGEGVDTKPAEWIILAGAGKSKNQLMQNIGRAMRVSKDKPSAKIIFLRDRGHKFLSRHFRECMRILAEEYGIKPIKLEIA